MDKNILIAQIEVKTGDIIGNTKKIIDTITNNDKSDFIIFPEMTISGYNCGDLFEQETFIKECEIALNEIVKNVGSSVAIVGFPRKDGKYLKNSAAIIHNYKIVDYYDKILLANDYHHEDRKYFKPGDNVKNFFIKDTSFSVLICEDIWYMDHTRNLVDEAKKLSILKNNKLDIIFTLNYSYFTFDKITTRMNILHNLSKNYDVDIVYCNVVGCGDIVKNFILYDGRSMYYKKGVLHTLLSEFKEDIKPINTNEEHTNINIITEKYNEIYNALIYGTKKILNENGLYKALVSVSGGIDSLVVGSLATLSLGKENVVFLTTPTNNNSNLTVNNVKKFAKDLDVELVIQPIQKYVDLYKNDLNNKYHPLTIATFEATFRTVTCLSLCNERKLTNIGCGNLDESYNGFFGFHDCSTAACVQIIDDLTKKEVFNLASFINKKVGYELIPKNMFDGTIKPMAELEDTKANPDPIDYPLASGICSALLRGSMSPKSLIDKYIDYLNNGENDFIEQHFNEECVYDKRKIADFEPKYVIDTIVLTVKNNLKSIYKQAQSAPNIILGKRSIGFSYRKTLINHYKYFENIREYGYAKLKMINKL